MTTTRKPKKPEEFKHWVQYQLKLNRSSFAHIARSLGVSRQAVTQSVYSPSERVADKIAAELKTSKKRLWPERFAA